MGRMQREKGKRFERHIAALLRERWPAAVVRRASQAERADNPDVFIEGGPPVLSRLWLELQDARNPTPLTKLEQAERDAHWWDERRNMFRTRLPVVIWHRLGGRTAHVTTRLWVLDDLRGVATQSVSVEVVTLTLSEVVAILAYASREQECAA